MRFITHLRTAVPLAFVAAFTACGDSPTEEVAIRSVELTAPTRTVAGGTPLQLSALVLDANNKGSTRQVSWVSSDTAIAAVDASGRVTARESGRATITASVGGVSDTLHLTAMRPASPSGPQSTFLAFSGTPGDWVSGGRTARYDHVNGGNWTVPTTDGRLVRLSYGGVTSWHLDLAAPVGQLLKVGTYENATRWPFQAASVPGLSFVGDGRGCNALTGRFVIHDIAVDHEGRVHRLHATFRQHCGGGAPYMDGEIAVLQFPLR